MRESVASGEINMKRFSILLCHVIQTETATVPFSLASRASVGKRLFDIQAVFFARMHRRIMENALSYDDISWRFSKLFWTDL